MLVIANMIMVKKMITSTVIRTMIIRAKVNIIIMIAIAVNIAMVITIVNK